MISSSGKSLRFAEKYYAQEEEDGGGNELKNDDIRALKRELEIKFEYWNDLVRRKIVTIMRRFLSQIWTVLPKTLLKHSGKKEKSMYYSVENDLMKVYILMTFLRDGKLQTTNKMF